MALDLALEELPTSTSSQSSSDIDLVQHLQRLFYDARRAKSDRYQTWDRNFRLLCSRYGGAAPYAWSPNPKDSEIYPILGAMVAWMTDQNVIIDASPAADPNSDFYTFMARIADDLGDVLYSNWVVLDYPSQIKLILWDAFLYGAGFLKTCWDNAIDNGYGNATLRRVNPWNFYSDPNATCMEDSEYFIEVHRWSYEEICRRYPDAESKLADSTGGMETFDEAPTIYSSNDLITRAPNLGALPTAGTIWGGAQDIKRSRYAGGSKPQYFTVYEYWVRENSEWSDDYSDLAEEASETSDPADRPEPELSETHVEDKWRVIVVTKGTVLLNELAEDLWSHKQHPYERYVFDDIGEFYGIALVDHLAYPQIYINRLLTSMQQNAELIGNPVFLEGANSGLGRTAIINKPGLRLRLQGPNAMANKPDWLHPPEMPAFIMQLVEFWISRMENVSGLSAIVRGQTPTARNAEGVISSIQEAAFVRIRSGLSNLEKTLERAGVKLCDLIIDNFTENRVMSIIGPSGEQSALVLQSRHFYGPTEKGAAPLKYSLLIRAGASMATSRQARIAENDTLYAMGVVDRQAVLEAHQYPNMQAVLKRIGAQMAEGTFNPPGARQRAGRAT